MAMNPMQRRATRSFVIGIFLGLMVAVVVAFLFYQKNKQLEADLTAIKAKQSKVMVAADNYESGALLTEDSLVMQEVQTTVPASEVLTAADFIMVDEETGATLIDEEGREKQNEIYLKVGVPAGTIITKDMVSIG
jgi:Flp pilus assembly protein CpaB